MEGTCPPFLERAVSSGEAEAIAAVQALEQSAALYAEEREQEFLHKMSLEVAAATSASQAEQIAHHDAVFARVLVSSTEETAATKERRAREELAVSEALATSAQEALAQIEQSFIVSSLEQSRIEQALSWSAKVALDEEERRARALRQLEAQLKAVTQSQHESDLRALKESLELAEASLQSAEVAMRQKERQKLAAEREVSELEAALFASSQEAVNGIKREASSVIKEQADHARRDARIAQEDLELAQVLVQSALDFRANAEKQLQGAKSPALLPGRPETSEILSHRQIDEGTANADLAGWAREQTSTKPAINRDLSLLPSAHDDEGVSTLPAPPPLRRCTSVATLLREMVERGFLREVSDKDLDALDGALSELGLDTRASLGEATRSGLSEVEVKALLDLQRQVGSRSLGLATKLKMALGQYYSEGGLSGDPMTDTVERLVRTVQSLTEELETKEAEASELEHERAELEGHLERMERQSRKSTEYADSVRGLAEAAQAAAMQAAAAAAAAAQAAAAASAAAAAAAACRP